MEKDPEELLGSTHSLILHSDGNLAVGLVAHMVEDTKNSLVPARHGELYHSGMLVNGLRKSPPGDEPSDHEAAPSLTYLPLGDGHRGLCKLTGPFGDAL